MPTLICCSAGRPARFVAQTLRTLVLTNVKMPILVIVPHAEVDAYRSTIEVHNPSSMNITVHGSIKGLTIPRQFARDMFSPEEHLVFIDDDIQRIRELRNDALHDVTDFDAMVAEGFQRMRDASACLWGIYPVANRGWQSDRVQVDTALCVSGLYGCRNDILPEPTTDDGEDSARQLAILASGGHVVRMCRYGIQSVYWRPGDKTGIQRTYESSTEVFKRLAAEHPNRVTFIVKRNGQPNLRWLRTPRG
jgi:hypothetical protein